MQNVPASTFSCKEGWTRSRYLSLMKIMTVTGWGIAGTLLFNAFSTDIVLYLWIILGFLV